MKRHTPGVSTSRPLAALIATVLLALCGCQVPTKQLNDYRQALQAARTAGEEILVDFGAAKKQFEEIAAERARTNPQREEDAQRLAFDPAAVPDSPSDIVLVRMKAWAVVGQYSDALVTLAEGRSASEVGGAVDGLFRSIASLSLDASTAIAPFAGVIKTVLEKVQRAIEVQQFRRAVEAADPLMAELEKLLVDDAGNFYNVHLGLRNLQYSARTDRVSDAMGRVQRLLEAHKHASTDGALSAAENVASINKQAHRLPNWNPEDDVRPASPGSLDYTTSLHAQIASELAEVERLVNEALRVDGALLDYRDALSRYVQMIRRVRVSHGALAAAAGDQRLVLPPPQDIISIVVGVREALTSYRSRK